MAKRIPPPEWAPYVQRLGVELHRRRIAAGLSQEQLAAAAGITRATYAQLEKGLSRPDVAANPSLYTLAALSSVLRVEVTELIPGQAPDVSAWR
ncbi:helix-turn-helix transcriptional regulator [Microbacterium sp. SORGH_AS_0862]|uniref:helix-turn-helix transcriptional regulator n=1 Tax=Microbacterium sp. SORGH_AS_0862 TaxID=3041789 RepID=UPI0035940A39